VTVGCHAAARDLTHESVDLCIEGRRGARVTHRRRVAARGRACGKEKPSSR
jgi:hypothetical protein